jgi:hypothetical protein
VKEIAVETPPEPIVDMTRVDLSLELASPADIPIMREVVRHCYTYTEEIDDLLLYFDFEHQFNMPDCACYHKIMQNNECIGVVNLSFTGMESMLIRNIAYQESDNNVYIFELLKQKYPDVLCWMMFFVEEEKENQYAYHDCEMKKQQFREDNGFIFYTNANRRNQFIKMMKPHDEVYNSSRYRFAILDKSMDNVSFRMCAMHGVDLYDNYMGSWRITDNFFGEALIYANTLERSRFFSNYMVDCDFRYNNLENSIFTGGSLKNCKIENCDLTGMTIEGINVEEALEYYKRQDKD